MPHLRFAPGHPNADKDGWVDIEQWYPITKGSKGPSVIRDEMDPTRHMADGKYYTSKAKFREATRAAGCVEVGNETSTIMKPRKPIQLDRRKRAEDIKRAIYELRNR